MQKEIWEKILDSIDAMTPEEYHDLYNKAKQKESIVLMGINIENEDLQDKLHLIYENPTYGNLTSVMDFYRLSIKILNFTSDKRVQRLDSLIIKPIELYYDLSDNLAMCG